jgi:hypothetical protein
MGWSHCCLEETSENHHPSEACLTVLVISINRSQEKTKTHKSFTKDEDVPPIELFHCESTKYSCYKPNNSN